MYFISVFLHCYSQFMSTVHKIDFFSKWNKIYRNLIHQIVIEIVINQLILILDWYTVNACITWKNVSICDSTHSASLHHFKNEKSIPYILAYKPTPQTINLKNVQNGWSAYKPTPLWNKNIILILKYTKPCFSTYYNKSSKILII